jgi:TPR repeat protein
MSLGVLYENGGWTKRDFEKAATWYRRSMAMDNNAQSTWNLACLIFNDRIVAQPNDPHMSCPGRTVTPLEFGEKPK